MFELLAEPVSAPRGELVTYASRSATRCSSDGVAEGDDVCPNSGDMNAMIPVSNKTRSITRVGYKHPGFWRQENTITILTLSPGVTREWFCEARHRLHHRHKRKRDKEFCRPGRWRQELLDYRLEPEFAHVLLCIASWASTFR